MAGGSVYAGFSDRSVYAVAAEGFQPVGVEVLARNSDEVAVKGVDADAQVALVDPLVDAAGEAAAGGGGVE